jgi:hypothetical protein
MERKLLDQVQDGDPMAVALRGGAGWIHGTVVWRREDVMLLKASDDAPGQDTPYVLVFLSDISAVALPREVEAPTPEPRRPGFSTTG